jgi:uncharacterized protein (DUF885 family)
MHRLKRYILCSILVCFVAITCCQVLAQSGASTNPGSSFTQTSEMHHLLVQYEADKGSLSRFYFVKNSPERRERFKKLHTEYSQKLQQLSFENFSTSGKIDYILFDRDVQEELRQLAIEEKEYTQIASWITFADKIYAIEKSRRRGAVPQAEQIAADLTAVCKEITEAKKVIAAQTSINGTLARRAESTVKGLQDALKSVFEFYNEYDPQFTWWVPEPYKKTDSLLASYASLFSTKRKTVSPQKDDGSGIAGNPIGRDELIRQLQYELIPYTPEEIIHIANKELAWCDQEMLKASREMGFGDKWREAMEKVKNTYVPVGKQPELILRLYTESIRFLKENDLITIPTVAEETWRMSMMSPERQLVNPFFLGGEEIIISYPTNTMQQQDKLMSMRGNNPHFSRATVHHELIAGHHLQFFMNDRYKTYRHFYTPFWIEGWALYWEFILWDLKFPQSPEDKIGMLFWRMHRCARILFSLNYHLGKWTPQQCIDFLVDRVGHERANAEGEVRRSFEGGYSPLYQLAYMIGGLQFYALKKELVDSKKLTYKQFHDAVMQENALPVELIRASLTNQPLPKAYKASWKFYTK